MIVLLTRASNNQPVSLTKQIADSGEGEVWETNQNNYLAKIYHDPTPARIEKLKVMLANPPADPMLKYNHVSIAWVSDLLKDSSGKYLGFLMPAIQDSKQLSSVYNPRRRKRVAPGFNWYYLHVTALNTAWIIQEIHAKGYVLGDIKLENILVNDRAMVAVIDTDSFQVRDSQSNKVYRCTVGSEGFTPVELLGKDFETTNQTEIHDRFRLGVLIHYLLFGYHPFSGQWTGVGESPEQTELIRQGFWYAAHNSPIQESRTTIPLDVVHPEVKKLFLQCFNDGHTQPHLRPTAEDWHNALEVAVNELTVCGSVDSHHYSRQYGKCYWCERAANLGVDIFPGVAGAAKIPSPPAQTTPYPKSSNQGSKQPTSSYSNNSPSTVVPSARPSKSSSQSKPSSSKKSTTKKVSTKKSSVKSSNSGLINRQKISHLKTSLWKRRKFLKMAGGSSLVLATGTFIYKRLNTFSDEAINNAELNSKIKISPGVNTEELNTEELNIDKPLEIIEDGSRFEFEVVTVNYRGQEIERKKHKAEYFIENLGSGVTLDMVTIPGGTFIMGSPEGQGRTWEKPQHQVTIPPFFMSKYPITQAQYQQVMNKNPSVFNGNQRPVEQVSWEDAEEFCLRLSKQTKAAYGLPSEAEWEYACRATTTTPYHFGETITNTLVNYKGNVGTTTNVGKFPPNAFGLYDMHGNVWEWCQDNWHDNYKNAPNDGTAWVLTFSINKIIRGGSWKRHPDHCRSAYRSYGGRALRYEDVGFRVVCRF